MRRHSPDFVAGRRLRAAFTLIELLMVVSIISLLLALLVPAVSSVLHRGKVAQVVSDVQGLANAADSFKGQYHVYPPSSITLHETQAGWDADPTSKALIRRIFGTEFDFSIPRDINGDGDMTDTGPSGITLNGQECLVFFLGGMPKKVSGKFVLEGFSSNRRDPFSRTGTSRTRFFTSFDASRLADANGNGMPEYHDIFNLPGTGPAYAYISTTNSLNAYISSHLSSTGMTSFYYQGSTSTPWKPDGFQIISAGADHLFGTGGDYNEQSGTAPSNDDRDNITNFSGGALAE